eukprot:2275855-Amphidinium_carterae.1
MERSSKTPTKRMLWIEPKDESTPASVVHLTVLGANHMAVLRKMLIGSTDEKARADSIIGPSSEVTARYLPTVARPSA